MKRYKLIYSQEGIDDLREIRLHIRDEASLRTAVRYVRRLKSFCAELSLAPHRGEPRNGLPGHFRTIGFEGRISVVFTISEEEQAVRILHFNYAGRDWDKH